jgi:hypothetical protein
VLTLKPGLVETVKLVVRKTVWLKAGVPLQAGLLGGKRLKVTLPLGVPAAPEMVAESLRTAAGGTVALVGLGVVEMAGLAAVADTQVLVASFSTNAPPTLQSVNTVASAWMWSMPGEPLLK